jgi:hypothetical protein
VPRNATFCEKKWIAKKQSALRRVTMNHCYDFQNIFAEKMWEKIGVFKLKILLAYFFHSKTCVLFWPKDEKSDFFHKLMRSPGP